MIIYLVLCKCSIEDGLAELGFCFIFAFLLILSEFLLADNNRNGLIAKHLLLGCFEKVFVVDRKLVQILLSGHLFYDIFAIFVDKWDARHAFTHTQMDRFLENITISLRYGHSLS